MRRTSSRRGISFFPGQNWEMHHHCWKLQSQNVQTFGFVYHDTNGPNHGPAWKTQSFLLKIYTVILWEEYYGKGISKKFFRSRLEKVRTWECFLVNREQGLLLSVYVDDIKLAEKKQNIDPMWKVLLKEVDLGEPTSYLDHVFLGCTQRECETSKDIMDKCRNMLESRISAGAKEKPLGSRKPDANISSWSYDMEGHAQKCVERYCELANETHQL